MPAGMPQDASRPAATDSDLDDDEWDVVPMPDGVDSDGRPRRRNAFIDFQMTTWVGTLSLKVSVLAEEDRETASNHSAMDRTPINDQSQSSLFQLPAEVRLCIYEHLMRVKSTDSGVTMKRFPPSTPTALTVLLTCRRVLTEAEEIFYSINRWCVDNPEFGYKLNARRREAVHKVALHVDNPSYALWILQKLGMFPNLRSIRMIRRMSIRYMDVSGWAVMVPQLAAEIQKLKALEDLRIITPEARDLQEHEQARQKKLEQKDQRLYDAVQNGPSASRRT